MLYSLFALTLLGVVIYIVLLIATIALPGFQVWPPPNKKSWQYSFTWAVTAFVAAGSLIVALCDSSSFGWDHWTRYVFGGALFVGGFAFGLWGLLALGSGRTSGLAGELETTGPYHFSRNPQYVGDIVGLLGAAILLDSVLAYGLWLPECIVFLLLPWVEEPWLKRQLGSAYTEYCRNVSPYIGFSRRPAGAPRRTTACTGAGGRTGS